MGLFFCSSSPTKMNLEAFVIIFLASSIFQDCLSQMPVTTYSSKSSEVLRCNISSQITYTSWTETAGDGRTIATIYEYNKGSGITPTSPTEGKYSNFVYDYNEDVNFDLVIENVNKDDGGIYSCISIPGPVTNSYEVQVEALPKLLELSCSPSPSRTCGGPDETLASSVDCSCTATEVSPKSLQLQWSISPSNVIRNETQDAGDYFSLISEVTITPTNTQESVTCSLTGYQSEGIDSSLTTRTYNFDPPECTLKVVSFDGMCTTAVLNCECTGGMPDTYTYSFFSENKNRIGGDSPDMPNIEVDITADEPFKFYCRGCNGIYGNTSLAEKADIVCTRGGGNTAAIVVGVVGGCVGVAVIVIIIIVILKKRENGVEGKSNDNTDGNGVNAKLASSPPEPTEPAEYASVNKPKSQPQAAPRSSAPPEKMELQYADLDHGNRGQSNEVRQPTNEPTEYATVQSVIV